MAKKGGGGKPGGEDPPTELPDIRYEINFPQLPTNSIGGVWINEVNNRGQVVGWYWGVNGRNAFLFAPEVDAVIDLNSMNLEGIPDGWRMASAVSINEEQVIVGYLLDEQNELDGRRGFALDLGASTPVVDLLPDLGAAGSYGRDINENGDILAGYEDVGGIRRAYLYNPGYYSGDPVVRALRDGLPLDLMNEIPTLLWLTGRAEEFQLNNPLSGRPAQIGGTNADGIAFRYTTGDNPRYETFPDVDLYWDNLFFSINDWGTFCGLARVPDASARGKKVQTTNAPFRYNTSLEVLPFEGQVGTPEDINYAGDLISSTHVFRDDWGWLPIDLLVDETDPDLPIWLSGTTIDLFDMSDRVTADDAGHIVGRLSGIEESPILFILTPIPAP